MQVKNIKMYFPNKQEFKLLQNLSNAGRFFLLKHADETVVAELDLEELGEMIEILSSNETTIKCIKLSIK